MATKQAARLHFARLLMQLRTERAEMRTDMAELVPELWHVLHLEGDVVPPKDKVTLRLDRATVRFFRALGPGYQSRINRVLAAYVQMQLAGLAEEDRAVGRLLASLRDPEPDAEGQSSGQ